MRTHRPAEHTVTEIVDNAKQRIEFQNPAYITIQNLLWVIENRTGIHNQHQRNVPQIFHIPEIHADRRKYHTRTNGQQEQIEQRYDGKQCTPCREHAQYQCNNCKHHKRNQKQDVVKTQADTDISEHTPS